MATNPQYGGFLAFENTWAKAILLKHIAIAGMVLIGAYQSFVLYPKITRSLLISQHGGDRQEDREGMITDTRLVRVNVLLSIVVLLLTAVARTA